MVYKNTWNLTGTVQQQQIVKEALDHIFFPWERLNLPNKPVEIGWTNLNAQALQGEQPEAKKHQSGTIGIIDGRQYVLGIFYTHTGKIYIDNYLVKYPEIAKSTVSAEIAHAVDYFLPLTDAMKHEIMALMHGGSYAEHGHTWWEKNDYSTEYYTLMGESFMQAFTVAYSDIPFGNTSDFTHSIKLTDGPKLRQIMGIERTDLLTTTTTTTQSTTTTTTQASTTSTTTWEDTTTTSSTTTTTTAATFAYFAKEGSEVFHDSHKKCPVDIKFQTRQDALNAGLRPCKVCKP